jgi:methylmalonyl-CoA mutase
MVMSGTENAVQLPYPIRFVTATSLFDGHDASINIIRRILQAEGAEVIHLGHNRSVNEIIQTAIQEDAHAIAVSAYQGGHVEFFEYMIDRLREENCAHICVFGGGGGVIVPEETQRLHAYGVERIYSPQDGQVMGLRGIIVDMLERAKNPLHEQAPQILDLKNVNTLARVLTCLESETLAADQLAEITKIAATKNIPVIGITGTGGAGKSSLTDELILRFRLDNPGMRMALIAIDPTRRKTGGALLGDRIRMNAIDSPHIYMRSLATRHGDHTLMPSLSSMIAACKAADYEAIFIETPGIGQGDASIVPFVDLSLYVMTPEFGASTQLEKIDMLDFANLVAINKCDRQGAQDALRDVRKQMQRNRQAFDKNLDQMPVYLTMASRFNDDGITRLYHGLRAALQHSHGFSASSLVQPAENISLKQDGLLQDSQRNYLLDIVGTIRKYHQQTREQAIIARHCQQLRAAAELCNNARDHIKPTLEKISAGLSKDNQQALENFSQLAKAYREDNWVYHVRGKAIPVALFQKSLSGLRIPKVALPRYHDEGDILTWIRKENFPGYFPFTAGVFPFKKTDEDPSRFFAGEGDAARTNKRFKFLSDGMPSTRLSTAFDSVTLYGSDPNVRPDIYGKIGNSGVSIATLDDMRVLFSGFDLCAPNTSVSMTINGPAPMILAMFMNAAIDQQVDKFTADNKRAPNADEHATLKKFVLENIRGTVQADILKEDQAQNTCLFSIDFALKRMVDMQAYFVEHGVRNFYSVSISGYHIAEAGANPISQLAFTLSNGFTYVEAYLARGMHIDDFAPNLAFFFSTALDPEYSVMGRVARRIWAVAMRDRYGANERSQKLKYHAQTSGRSLHAQEMDFNDIRTTLEALMSIYDNCNSLHTNAYDEAVTTPTEASVRRALAIQLIINREFGLTKNENPLQGAFIIDELTDLVEEAVLNMFEEINRRGGVLGAMETGYQRGKIQDESMVYEIQKHNGELPIVGVNTFLPKNKPTENENTVELARSTTAEKDSQLARLHAFQARNLEQREHYLKALADACQQNQNVFAVLMDAVRYCSLGEISELFFKVGGKYRRSM